MRSARVTLVLVLSSALLACNRPPVRPARSSASDEKSPDREARVSFAGRLKDSQPVVSAGSRVGLKPFGLCEKDFCWDSPTPQGRDLLAAWAVAKDDVWFGGDRVLLHWDGASWRRFDAGKVTHLWGSAANDVWALDDTGVLHWDGSTWSRQVEHTGWRDLWGISASDVWAVGDDGAWRWDGTQWSQVFSGWKLVSVWGQATDDVWVVAAHNAWLWDGYTWEAKPPGLMYAPNYEADDERPAELSLVRGVGNVAWVVGTCGTYGVLSNGQWTQTKHRRCYGGDGDTMQYYDLFGLSDGDVWFPFLSTTTYADYSATAGVIHVDETGEETQPLGGQPQAVAGTSRSDIWAVGMAGRIWHWDGTEWSLKTASFRQDLESIWADDCGRVFAAFSNHLIDRSLWRRDADGWVQDIPVRWGVGAPNIVTGSGCRESWMTDMAGGIWHRNAGDWQPLPPTGISWPALWVDPEDHVWAAGVNDQVLEWNGVEWVPHSTALMVDWGRIDGTSARDIWLGGLERNSSLREHLAHFDGSEWREIEVPISRIDGLQAATPGELWIVGNGSPRKEVWRYSGYGWANMGLPEGSASVRDVQLGGRGAKDVWALVSAWEKDRYSYSLHHFDGDGWSSIPFDFGGKLMPLASGQLMLGGGEKIVIVNPSR